MALTDTEIRRSKKKEKPYKLSDGGNLFLWVTPSGGKLWRWAYRYEGKEKLMTFGRYPEVSLALARERHLGARTLLAAGIDPMAERKVVKSAAQVADESSFTTLAGRWMEHWQQGKSPHHVDSVRRRMAADILPRLGARSIAEINSSELVAMIKTIEQRGAGDIAKRALQVPSRARMADRPLSGSCAGTIQRDMESRRRTGRCSQHLAIRRSGDSRVPGHTTGPRRPHPICSAARRWKLASSVSSMGIY
jgi:hypothetical protein